MEQAARLERCVPEVKRCGDRVNPFAACTASVGCRRALMKREGVAEVVKAKAAGKKVADLTVGELKAIIHEMIEESLEQRQRSRFWNPKTFDELAAEQGVRPIKNLGQLRGRWPEGEDVDDFLEAIHSA